MRVALVYDHLNKVGGAEVVLQNFHALYPEADWYTSVWNKKRTPFSSSWKVTASWLNRIPVLRNHHELVPFLMPFIFESFDLSDYDLVISIGSDAKGVITRAGTLHLNYCLTPTRYLWSHQDLYLSKPQFGLLQRVFTPLIKLIFRHLRNWDLVASTRPDHMISISEHVKKRVQKYYNRESKVIHPPVNLKKYSTPKSSSAISHAPYYLTVSRLVPYKNIDLLIKAFANSNRQLIVVGTGSELSRLKKLATNNILIVGEVSNKELHSYYQNCLAFVQANTEDFGISMVEALSAGKPVIAYYEGGAGEIVQDGKTGLLVKTQSVKAFQKALDTFETMEISPSNCINSAKQFDSLKWQKRVKSYISNAYAKQQKQ